RGIALPAAFTKSLPSVGWRCTAELSRKTQKADAAPSLREADVLAIRRRHAPRLHAAVDVDVRAAFVWRAVRRSDVVNDAPPSIERCGGQMRGKSLLR